MSEIRGGNLEELFASSEAFPQGTGTTVSCSDSASTVPSTHEEEEDGDEGEGQQTTGDLEEAGGDRVVSRGGELEKGVRAVSFPRTSTTSFSETRVRRGCLCWYRLLFFSGSCVFRELVLHCCCWGRACCVSDVLLL